MKLEDKGITVATLDVTYKCNYRCLHCYNSSGEHNFGKELTDDELKTIMNSYCELNPRAICICGGEPLTRKNIVVELGKMFHDAHPEKGCNMVSNGYFMTQDIANELKEAGFNLVQISLDGAKPESHNWLRQNDEAYDHAISAIKFLKKAGLEVGVACAPSKVNIDEFEDLVQMCFDLGVSNFRSQPMMRLGRAQHIDEFLLDDFSYLKLGRKVNKLNFKYEAKGMKVEWGDPVQHLTRINVGMDHLDTLIINGYGDILISPYLPLSFGNIRKYSLEEYFSNGLDKVYENALVRKMAGLVTDCNSMNLNSNQVNLPKIFSGDDIKIDIIDEDLEKTSEKYMKELFGGYNDISK